MGAVVNHQVNNVPTIEKELVLIMHDIINSPITWIVLAAMSEIIALTPLKDNSVIELLFTALRSIKPKKH